MKLKKGFTLIELLIVIAIIGILAVALLPAITTGPARARDAARIASVNSIAAALEQINIDTGSYPTLAPGTDPTSGNAATDCLLFTAGIGATIRDAMGSVPTVARAPAAGGATTANLCTATGEQFFYKNFSGGTSGNYMIAVQVERSQAANWEVAITGDASTIRTAADRAAVLAATDGGAPTATSAYFYVVAK